MTDTYYCAPCDREYDRYDRSHDACPILRPRKPEKAATANPKDAAGRCKANLALLPVAALAEVALAMEDGADKYNPANWRDPSNAGVEARTYVSALQRHSGLWFDGGEERAADSKAHHLAHAAACCLILLDAQAAGRMIDNRPHPGPVAAVLQLVADLRAEIVELKRAAGKPVSL